MIIFGTKRVYFYLYSPSPSYRIYFDFERPQIYIICHKFAINNYYQKVKKENSYFFLEKLIINKSFSYYFRLLRLLQVKSRGRGVKQCNWNKIYNVDYSSRKYDPGGVEANNGLYLRNRTSGTLATSAEGAIGQKWPQYSNPQGHHRKELIIIVIIH